jgi:hypothetical protein
LGLRAGEARPGARTSGCLGGPARPVLLGLFVGIVVVLGLLVAGAPLFLVCFGGVFAATAAASLASLLGDELTATDLTGPIRPS